MIFAAFPCHPGHGKTLPIPSFMHDLLEAYTSMRRQPKNLHLEDISLFAHEFSKEIPGSHFREVPNAFVLGDTVLTIRPFKFYEQDTQMARRKARKYLKQLPLLFTRSLRINKALWITDDKSDNYFHWLTDCLTRLLAIEPFLTPDTVLLLPGKLERLSFVRDTLSAFSISVVYYDPARAVLLDTLILPTHIAPAGNYHSGIIGRVRERLSRPVIPAGRNIYVSRRNAARRTISNEEEVRQTMEANGFESHYFENYSFADQTSIMSQTHCLAGLHGAGLANMIFMPPGGEVLEMRIRNDFRNNCYFSLASEMGHDYYYLLNNAEGQRTLTSIVTVDVQQLKETLLSITAR
jgi:hypothetical protein